MHHLIQLKDHLLSIFLIFLSFVSPIKGMVLLVIFAVALDTTIGIYKSIKLGKFSSDKLFNVVVKTFFYSSTILLSYLVSNYIFDGELFGVDYLSPKLVTAFWVYIEIKSIDESSIELGNKSFFVIAKDLIKGVKAVKKDLKDLQN